jgi:hypothetical protein
MQSSLPMGGQLEHVGVTVHKFQEQGPATLIVQPRMGLAPLSRISILHINVCLLLKTSRAKFKQL